MSRTNSAPSRTLPARPSLEQVRKQAKELLQAYRAGDVAAVAEVERFESQPDAAKFALADAQRVLARAYGFASWTKLKQQVRRAGRQQAILEARERRQQRPLSTKEAAWQVMEATYLKARDQGRLPANARQMLR